MKKDKIIEHYKSYFDIENEPLGEHENQIIDWVEELLKNNFIKANINQCPNCKEGDDLPNFKCTRDNCPY